MKTIPNLQIYKPDLIQIFNTTVGIEILMEKLKLLFKRVLECYPYMRLPEFKIIPTESLKFSIWYQEPDAITETLNIRQEKTDLYLWRCIDKKWYLNDLYSDNDVIADVFLNEIIIFHIIPENPKEVKTLLENGLMDFKPENFPKFSEKKVTDLNEVLTWDDRFILVGTNVENLKIYNYQEWDKLIQRENFYQ